MKYDDSYPPSSLIHLSYPQRGDLPPVQVHWYDGGLLPDPVVAALLELERQCLVTSPQDAPVREHVHEIGLDVVEEPLIVRHQDDGTLG